MPKDILKKSEAFYEEYLRAQGTDPHSTTYCPGCGHGIVHKMIAEALEDFGVFDKTILMSPVGCSVFAYYYFKAGNIQCAHGRAPAVATGIKRAIPHSIVISYQGDGDLAAIGFNNIMQAANRGENITVFFINNAIYGMTGGQMAPTTLIGQKTTTTPMGRRVENEGYPVKVSEVVSILEAPVYVERTALNNTVNINKTRKAVRKAIKNQIDRKGFSLVEILSGCPTGWKVTPVQAKEWITEYMIPYFKLGCFKDISEQAEPRNLEKPKVSHKEILKALGVEENGKLDIPITKEKYTHRIKVAGFGGQGVLLLGEMLAESGMISDKEVTWLPSYGPEMRGGTANCHVIISDDKIYTPVVDESDVLIALNKPSLVKFETDIVKDGLILYDTSLIDIEPARKDVRSIGIPFTEESDKIGNARIANMMALGAYIGATNALTVESVLKAQEICVKRKQFWEMNEKAIRRGIELVKEKL